MHKIHIANVLLTRRCNLSCSYCNIIRNYKNKPAGYPDMSHYKNNELSGDQWIEIFKRLKANNDKVFLVIYGGEPTMYEDFVKIIDFCNKNEIYYTVISNSTVMAREILYKTVEQIGPFRGLTASVDPIAWATDVEDDIVLKTNEGLENLTKMKADGLAEDVVAEITCLNESIDYLIPCVTELSSRGIFSSITTVDDQKSEYYDFSTVKSDQLIQPTQKVKDIFNYIYDHASKGRLLVHIPDMLDDIYDALPSKNFCNLNEDIHNATIEPNGRFRLCLRVRGIDAANLPYEKVISEDGVLSEEFIQAIREDYESYCEGCNWSCVMMTQKHMDAIIDH